MGELQDPGLPPHPAGLLAGQDRGQVRRADPAVEARGRGQGQPQLRHRNLLLGRSIQVQAVVAGPAAAWLAFLSEVVGDARVAAAAMLGIGQHLPEARVCVLLQLRVARGKGLLDEERLQVAVGGRPEQQALGRFAVPAGSPRLLVVGLKAARGVAVEHLADVGEVDAHAEGRGGDDHVYPARGEALVHSPALFVGQPPVIGAGPGAPAGQELGQLLGRGHGAGVDQRPAVSRPYPGQQRLALAGLTPAAQSREPEIGTVEPGHHDEWVLHA